MKMIQTEKMKISENAFNEIINYIASKPAESGGALFGKEDDYVIHKFISDTQANTTRSTYTINSDYLNPVIKKLWEEEGLSLIGIVHSHPHGYASLSSPDIQYFTRLLSKISRKKFYAPIVFSIPDGGFKLFPYILSPDGKKSQSGAIEIVQENTSVKEEFTYEPDQAQSAWDKRVNSVFHSIIELELFLLRVILIAWVGWLAIKILIPSMLDIHKIFENATK